MYVIGESDNTGWTVASTDMFFLRIKTDKTVDYIKTLGGTQGDKGVKIVAASDGYVYGLG